MAFKFRNQPRRKSADLLRTSVAHSSAKGLKDVIKEIRSQTGPEPVDALLYFSQPREDFAELSDRLHAEFGAPSIGCTTAGEISSDKGHCNGGIVVSAIRSPSLTMSSALIENASNLNATTALRTVSDLTKACGGASFGLVLIDGLSMAEEQVSALLSHALGQIPFVGGSAGDDLCFKETWVAANGIAAMNAAAVAVVKTSNPFRMFHSHHFEASDQRLVVTGAVPSERRVTEINGEAATVGYANAIGVPLERLSPEVFAKHPVMLRVGGEYYVRSIQKANDDGSLTFFCAIDEGLVLRIGFGRNLPSVLSQEFDRIESEIGTPGLTICFDCILRRLELFGNGQQESVRGVTSRSPLIGFSTYGEQYNGLHVNQTLTGVAIGRAA